MDIEVGVYESQIFKGNMSQATKMTGTVSSEIYRHGVVILLIYTSPVAPILYCLYIRPNIQKKKTGKAERRETGDTVIKRQRRK
jgi:hypothetical protein